MLKLDWLDRFSRVTSDKHRFIPEIDGLRFFAIFTVFLLHTGTHIKRTLQVDFTPAPESTILDWITSRGGLGVDVFFAISGFILALPFAQHYLTGRQAIRLNDYYVRRLTRLEPPYILSLIVFFVLQLALHVFSFKEGAPHFLASLFYVHNLVYNEWSTINPVAWSLEVEVQFYLLAPLIFKVFALPVGRRRVMMVTTALMVIAINVFFRDAIADLHLRKSLLVYLPLFIAGILLADIFVDHPAFLQSGKKSFLYDAMGATGIALLFIYKNSFLFFPTVIYTLAVMLLILAGFKGVILNAFFRLKIITVIGGMCYSIYLLHYASIAFLARFTDSLVFTNNYEINYGIQFLIFAPVVLAISAVYFLLIEKPCMRRNWHLKLWEKIQSRLGVAQLEKYED